MQLWESCSPAHNLHLADCVQDWWLCPQPWQRKHCSVCCLFTYGSHSMLTTAHLLLTRSSVSYRSWVGVSILTTLRTVFEPSRFVFMKRVTAHLSRSWLAKTLTNSSPVKPTGTFLLTTTSPCGFLSMGRRALRGPKNWFSGQSPIRRTRICVFSGVKIRVLLRPGFIWQFCTYGCTSSSLFCSLMGFSKWVRSNPSSMATGPLVLAGGFGVEFDF